MHFKKISAGAAEDNSSTFKYENIFGEREKADRLIVMDTVPGLAYRSNRFASFFDSCEKVQIQLFILFSRNKPRTINIEIDSVVDENFKYITRFGRTNQRHKNSLGQLCSRNCIYVPKKSLWISRFFCRGISLNGLGKFRIRADDTEEQSCYYNIRINDKLYNTFMRKRVRNTSSDMNSIQF